MGIFQMLLYHIPIRDEEHFFLVAVETRSYESAHLFSFKFAIWTLSFPFSNSLNIYQFFFRDTSQFSKLSFNYLWTDKKARDCCVPSSSFSPI